MPSRDWHGYQDSVQWRLTEAGVEIDGTGLERSQGNPVTVTKVWNAYADIINPLARELRIPCELIVATISTESLGSPTAIRKEPGYVSDEQTPDKISIGPMQTLLSTAREVMQMSFGRDWLLIPKNAIEAGTRYIAVQSKKTNLDPPLVAAAYNAGGLYHQTGPKNRWKLRQYPIGTAAHCDRFVRFFNDAVFVLSRHPKKPLFGLNDFLGGGGRARQPEPSRLATSIKISFGQNANAADVTPYSMSVLTEILKTAQLTSALISSTSRSPADQARVMYDNLQRYGIAHQKKLYGQGGDAVIDVYSREHAAGKSPTQIKAAMTAKILEIGPTKVSRHAADPKVLNVFDVAPSSISNKRAFEKAVEAHSAVKTFLRPPDDPGYHLEIPQPK